MKLFVALCLGAAAAAANGAPAYFSEFVQGKKSGYSLSDVRRAKLNGIDVWQTDWKQVVFGPAKDGKQDRISSGASWSNDTGTLKSVSVSRTHVHAHHHLLGQGHQHRQRQRRL